jgi:hypothetical protein
MKVYVLMYKDEILAMYKSEYDAKDSHRWTNEDIKADMKIVTGTLTLDN